MENSIFQIINNKTQSLRKSEQFYKKFFKEVNIAENELVGKSSKFSKDSPNLSFSEIFQSSLVETADEKEASKNILEALLAFLSNMLNTEFVDTGDQKSLIADKLQELNNKDNRYSMAWLSKLFDKMDELNMIDLDNLNIEAQKEKFEVGENIDVEKLLDVLKKIKTESKKEGSVKSFENLKNIVAHNSSEDSGIKRVDDKNIFEIKAEKFLDSSSIEEKSLIKDIDKNSITLKDLNFSKDMFEVFGLKHSLNQEKTSIQSTPPTINMNQSSKISDLIELIEFVKNGETKKISVKLEPDFLGKMNIHLSDNAGKLSAKIFVEQDSVRHFLISNLEAIKQQLNEKGIFIDNMDFMFMGDYKNQDEFKKQAKLFHEKQKSGTLNEENVENIKTESHGVYA
jgi:flagellar hook-length control protein FliK